MWYEILPSIGIIFGAMCIGGGAATYMPYLLLGKPGQKQLHHPWEFEYYLRDRQLTGSAYKLKGLEAIPDESDCKSK